MKKMTLGFLLLSALLMPSTASANCYKCTDDETPSCSQVSWWGGYELAYTNCSQTVRCFPSGVCLEVCQAFGSQCTFWDV